MAKLKIVGITESKGIYNEIKYRNFVLNLTTADDNTIGSKVETAKVKWKNLDDVFGLEIPEDTTCESYFKLNDFVNLVGSYCHIYYDKYRTVTQVVVEPKKTDSSEDSKKSVDKSDSKIVSLRKQLL